MKKILFLLFATTLANYSHHVCGADGITYESEGDCYNNGIKIIHVGPCLKKAIDHVYWRNTDDHGNWNNKKFIPWKSFLTRVDTGNPYQSIHHNHTSGGFGHHHHDHSHYPQQHYQFHYDLIGQPVYDNTNAFGLVDNQYVYDASKFKFGNWNWWLDGHKGDGYPHNVPYVHSHPHAHLPHAQPHVYGQVPQVPYNTLPQYPVLNTPQVPVYGYPQQNYGFQSNYEIVGDNLEQ